jgi:hypothetical protein
VLIDTLARVVNLPERTAIIPNDVLQRAVRGLDATDEVMDVLNAIVRCPAVLEATYD